MIMRTYQIDGKEVVVIREGISESNETLFKRIVELILEINNETDSSNKEKEWMD